MSDVTNKKSAEKRIAKSAAAKRAKPKKKKIKTDVIFVCTGNTCRSPMAEYIFKSYLEKKRKSGLFNVSSAGIYAEGGEPMTENALAALSILGVSAKPRTAVALTPQAAEKADLIVCMTPSHAAALARYGGKVTTVAALTGGPDVPDPFGCGVNVYVKTAEYLSYAAQDIYAAAIKISDAKQNSVE